MTDPRISICIPTYNGERFLAETLESASAQAGDDIEIFVSDDHSTDKTLEIAERYATRDPRIRIIVSDKNRGLVGNWNHCIFHARGEWIKFLFQDDLLLPEYTQRVRPCLEGPCPFIINRREFLFEPETPGNVVNLYRSLVSLSAFVPRETVLTQEDFSWLIANFLGYNFIGEPSNTMFRRTVIADTGYFNTNMHQIVDLEFWARIGNRFGAVYIPDTLSIFRVHMASTTSKTFGLRDFRTLGLDTLIMLHDLCYSPSFRNVREAAYAGNVSLEDHLIAQVKLTNRQIASLEKTSLNSDMIEKEVFSPLGWCCRHYPILWNIVKSAIPNRAAALMRLFPEELT